MKLHERTILVQKANVELGSWVLDWIQKHDLTWIEAIRLLIQRASDFTKYQLRDELHGTGSDKKADEA